MSFEKILSRFMSFLKIVCIFLSSVDCAIKIYFFSEDCVYFIISRSFVQIVQVISILKHVLCTEYVIFVDYPSHARLVRSSCWLACVSKFDEQFLFL